MSKMSIINFNIYQNINFETVAHILPGTINLVVTLRMTLFWFLLREPFPKPKTFCQTGVSIFKQFSI